MYKFGKLERLSREAISTKHAERVKQFGEVFTPPSIVSDMLDLLPDFVHSGDTESVGDSLSMTFLEPSCGDGNFLVEIVERKLRCAKTQLDVLIAVSSAYGVDIQADNVLESRRRVYNTVLECCESKNILLSDEIDEQLCFILYKNIVLGNTLADRMIRMDNEGYVRAFSPNEEKYGVQLTNEVNTGNSTFNLIKSDGTRVDVADILTRRVRDISRVVFNAWEVVDGNLVGHPEFLYDDLEEKSEVSTENLTISGTQDEMKAKFKNLFV